MATLVNSLNEKILSQNLIIADTLWSRMKGLLGHTQLSDGEMMWIHRCNSIHTFFMRFSIDCVFLNRDFQVCSIHPNVSPWRIIWPSLKAHSVIEMAAGQAAKLGIQKGDKLHVGN